MTELPRQGRICAVDYGTVRIGLAITDPGQTLASPLEIYNRRNERLDTEYFRKLAVQERIVGFVVGLPVHLAGHGSRISDEATAFGEWLATLTSVPVIWFDERYTSSIAEEIFRDVKRTRLQKRRLLDKLAAQVLLKNWLESDRDNPPHIQSFD